jgi:membrane protease YdiL (CAAX protease family)
MKTSIDDPAREASILVLATVVLTVIHFHGHVASLGPREELFGWFAVNVALLLVVPALVIRFGFRERLFAYGLRLGEPRVWGRDLGALALVLLPVAFFAARLPSIREAYPAYRYVLAEPWLWIPSTLGWGLYCFAWEFFFRGFLLFGLGRRLGSAAIFIQLVPFVMAHYPKSEPEAFASIGGGLLFAVIAWRGESFLGAWLLHWGLATAVNVFAAMGK